MNNNALNDDLFHLKFPSSSEQHPDDLRHKLGALSPGISLFIQGIKGFVIPTKSFVKIGITKKLLQRHNV